MSSAPTIVNFWFEFASPYSMISALRLFYALSNKHAPNAAQAQNLPSCHVPDLENIRVNYRPIFLGGVFKAVGQQFLPNVAVPIKGSYLFHDVQRSLNLFGCPGFPGTRPALWPRNTALAGRMAWMLSQGPEYIRILDSGRRPPAVLQSKQLEWAHTKTMAEFVWRVYESEFIANEDIGSGEVMARLWDAFVARPSQLSEYQLPDGQRAVSLASEEAVKEGFKASTQMAVDLGVFGAPTFTTDDGDLYWGNDRMLEALSHHRVCDKIGQNAGFCARASNNANL
ncbi:hypothetical protein LPJ56_003196 [Coemansia sp. RSA 2599]|nr:hypothetical protein LPJ56_003196 [Coemansia sp. RSA 2599]